MLSSSQSLPLTVGEEEEEEEEEINEDSMLLYNIANQVAESILDQGQDEEQALAAVTDVFSSMLIAPPMLQDFPLALHVQFWDENDSFCFELDEIVLAQSLVHTYCTTFKTKPVRARMDFLETERGEEESGIQEITRGVPERGTVNLILTIYAPAPVLVGLVCQPYGLFDQDEKVQKDDGEVFQTGGKRIHWLSEAFTKKRQRNSLSSDGKTEIKDSADENDLTDMFLGMSHFSEREYCTSVNSDTAVVGFSFSEITQELCQVRVALALHKLILRLSLQSILDNSRNTL